MDATATESFGLEIHPRCLDDVRGLLGVLLWVPQRARGLEESIHDDRKERETACSANSAPRASTTISLPLSPLPFPVAFPPSYVIGHHPLMGSFCLSFEWAAKVYSIGNGTRCPAVNAGAAALKVGVRWSCLPEVVGGMCQGVQRIYHAMFSSAIPT